MGRLIDEDEVIEALIDEGWRSKRYKLGETWELNLHEIRKAIATVPTAQSDSLVRQSARWMSIGHKMARICSNCFSDEPYKFADNDADVYNFCPHCGAKMEEQDDYE